jgi:glycosyltransferase involved in cell wall biosynthesis
LRSLAGVDYPDWETIVVAGGDDGTYESALEGVRALGRARVIPQEPRGKPAALNAGLGAASGEVVVLLDADSDVEAGWLRALVAPLDASCRATTGRAVPTRLTAITRGEQMERIVWYEILGQKTLQGAASIAIEKALIEQLGGFAPDSYADDWELDARVASLGIDRAYCRDAVVRTVRPSTLREYWHNEIRWRRAHLASLIRLRHYFFGDALTGLKSVYPYLLAWGGAAISGGALVIVATGSPDDRRAAIGFWAIAVAWLLLRRSSLPLEVAAYTGDRRWLRDLWVPPVLFGITLLASIWGTVTLRRVTLDFKGPRAIPGDRPT